MRFVWCKIPVCPCHIQMLSALLPHSNGVFCPVLHIGSVLMPVKSGFLSAGVAAGIGLLGCNMSSSHSVLYLFSHFLFNFLILLNALYRRFSIITYDGRTFCNFIDSSTFQTYLNISLSFRCIFDSFFDQ